MDTYSYISENGTVRQIEDLIAKAKNEEQDESIRALDGRTTALEAVKPINKSEKGSLNGITSGATYVFMQPYRQPTEIGMTLAEFNATLADAEKKSAPMRAGSARIAGLQSQEAWYNFIFIPHRNGEGADNADYGTVFYTEMTQSTKNVWIQHLIGGIWHSVKKIISE